MSIKDFSDALKNRAIKEWFNAEKGARASQKLANINTLVNATSMYRSAEKTAEKNSFLITKTTVRDLVEDLKGLSGADLDTATDIAFNKFKSKGGGVTVNRRLLPDIGGGIPAVYFSTISFEAITVLVNNILDLKPSELSNSYEKGHVVGLNTELLRVTANRINEIDARGAPGTKQAKQVILKELNNVIEYYKQLDYDSANIQPAGDVPVYASVNKTIGKTGKTKYLVEIQPKVKNQLSASEVKKTIGSIRKLFDPGALTETAMADLIDDLIPKVSSTAFVSDLLTMKTSPSFLDMIGTHIVGTLTGTTVTQQYTHTNIPIIKVAMPKVNLTGLRSIIKTELSKVTALKNKLLTPSSYTPKPDSFNLSSLQVLLNTHLQDVVSANMGNGNDRSVLNYRTGRLAASAKVERLTMSKAGMVTAFYSYMKNPYQTFEPGFRQGNPPSRSPKLLVSKSIREIAATSVGNKLRAVLI